MKVQEDAVRELSESRDEKQTSRPESEANATIEKKQSSSGEATTWKRSEEINPRKVAEQFDDESSSAKNDHLPVSQHEIGESSEENKVRGVDREEETVILINPPTLLPQPKPLDFVEQANSEVGQESYRLPQSS